MVHILVNFHISEAKSDVCLDRIDMSFRVMKYQLDSMKIGGRGMIREDMKIAEAHGKEENGDWDDILAFVESETMIIGH